jgi:hypothetical protein
MQENASTTYLSDIISVKQTRRMGFQVLTRTSTEMSVLWDAAPYSLIDIGRCFGSSYCVHHQGDQACWRQ